MLVLYFRFLTHHNLQGSQTQNDIYRLVDEFLTHHNLQGSQTKQIGYKLITEFLTHHNLQGSQTNHNHNAYQKHFLYKF